MTITKFYRDVKPGEMTMRERIDATDFVEGLADAVAGAIPDVVGVHVELVITVSTLVKTGNTSEGK